jgi:hypothetical protein
MAPHTLVLRLFDFAKAPDAAKYAKAMGVCRMSVCRYYVTRYDSFFFVIVSDIRP